MPSTTASMTSRPVEPSFSASANTAEHTGPAGWMMVFRCVSSKSKACELTPLMRAALPMSTRAFVPSTRACSAGSNISAARSAACSIAVRDSVVNGIKVKKGQYIGLVEEKIVCAGDQLLEVAAETLGLAAEGAELISIYYGNDMPVEQAEELVDELKKINGDWEIELFDGGQPLYPLLMVIE